MLTLDEIKRKVDHVAKLLDGTQPALPTYGYSDGSGRPHIEVDERGYHYVMSERGHEFDRWTTQNVDVLLYAVFRSVTFELACAYELKHRVAGQDFRRILFQKQLETMSILSSAWAARLSKEKGQLLQVFPFDDKASERAALAKELRDQGISPDDASYMAEAKYPSPSRGSLEDGRKLLAEQRMEWEDA